MHPTNVLMLYSFVKNSKSQVTYYQPGYGPKDDVISTFQRRVAETLDKYFDRLLSLHLLDGYEFLVRKYNTGDKICLFGFARGAYVARALAGMLSKVGLLKEENPQYSSQAYRLFTSKSKSDLDAAETFKINHCHAATVDFLGVWETMASLGYNVRQTLPFADGDGTVRVFRQAVALDECCKRPPILYKSKVEESIKEKVTQEVWPDRAGTGNMRTTDVKQTWFIGTHAGSIHGNSSIIGVKYSISYISLRWMIEELVEAGYRHLFPENPRTINESLHSLILSSPEQCPATPQDAMVQDLLDLDNFKQKMNNCNIFKRGRVLPANPLFHRSVQAFMEKNATYRPKAVYTKGSERYGL
ncbi:hypothetical protein BGW80DRAFT_1345748 [Lactifluus volemus]|nr:hypothetical protein BGW80DRAFT_1345748 [Lactifluus volemus]